MLNLLTFVKFVTITLVKDGRGAVMKYIKHHGEATLE